MGIDKRQVYYTWRLIQMAGKNDRFETVHSQRLGIFRHMDVIRDKDTGVNYLRTWFINSAGGVTVIVDKEGKPVVTE
jgi:hypothetical protein